MDFLFSQKNHWIGKKNQSLYFGAKKIKLKYKEGFFDNFA